MEVRGWLSRGDSVEAADFAGLSSVPVQGVRFDDDGRIVVTFAGDLSPAEAQAVADRIESRNPSEAALRAEVRKFLSLTAPTPEQTAAGLAALASAYLNLSSSTTPPRQAVKSAQASTKETR